MNLRPYLAPTALPADRFFDSVRYLRLRYSSQEITPKPIIDDAGVQNQTEISSELTEGENYQVYQVAISKQQLIKVFGSLENGIAKIQPGDGNWWIKREGEDWFQCRTIGEYQTEAVRFQFKLIRLGVNDL